MQERPCPVAGWGRFRYTRADIRHSLFLNRETECMDETCKTIMRDAAAGGALGASAAREMLPALRGNLLDAMAVARVALSDGGARPFTCGIVNAKSGRCRENCAFCAQSAHHRTGVAVYPLISEDEMLGRAESLAGAGTTYMGMVASGTGPTPADLDSLCRMGEKIRARVDIKLCASLGILGRDEMNRLAGAGFASYHHNLETARSHYPKVCSSHDYERRVETVRNAKAAGLRVCSGGIFGIGETWEERVELSAELAELGVDSIPVNLLAPIAGTPLGGMPPPAPGEALLVIALLRLMHPGRDIVVCGGRSGLGRFETLIFSAGANGLMVGDYLTTKGGRLEKDLELLRTLGLAVRR